MNRSFRWSFISIAALIIITAGYIIFVRAQEKQEIPDHTDFQSCDACHPEKLTMWEASNHGKAIGRIAGNDPSATSCAGCHSSARPATKLQNTKGEARNQESHHKVACLACHSRQKTAYVHRLLVDPEMLCDVCHTQRTVFWGKGAKGIEDSRNFHSGVPCISCHMTEGNHNMKVLRPDDPGLTEQRLDTCTACHKDNNRQARVQQIQEWQSTYDENMAPLLADVKAIDAALEKNPGLMDASLKSKFDDVKANLAILENDRSRGFHNFVFSLEITGMASGDLKEIKAAIK